MLKIDQKLPKNDEKFVEIDQTCENIVKNHRKLSKKLTEMHLKAENRLELIEKSLKTGLKFDRKGVEIAENLSKITKK